MNKLQPLYIIIKIEFPVGFLPKQLAYNNHSFIVFNLSNGTCESMHDSLDSAQKKIIELLDKSEKIETGEKKPTTQHYMLYFKYHYSSTKSQEACLSDDPATMLIEEFFDNTQIVNNIKLSSILISYINKKILNLSLPLTKNDNTSKYDS